MTVPASQEIMMLLGHSRLQIIEAVSQGLEVSAFERVAEALGMTERRLTVMGLLGSSEVTLKTEQTEFHHGLGEETPALKAVYDRHLPFLTETFSKWEVSAYPLKARTHDEAKQLALYRYLRDLSNPDLTGLYNALIAWTFGSWPTEQPDTGDSLLALEIASDLELDMLEHFTLDETFLSLYRKAKLSERGSV